MAEHRRAVAVTPDSPDLPGLRAVDARAASENFPVALRLLGNDRRRDLVAVYGFARLTDEIGDSLDGDRLAALDWLEADLERAPDGAATHPVVARLTPTLRQHDLTLDPFRDLIEANRRDQTQHRYETYDDLLDYCRYSANPIGRLVLAIFGVHDASSVALSDQVCSGLQLVEHLQDVAEDHRAGRVYLPREHLRQFGCSVGDLIRPRASPGLRQLVAFECGLALQLLGAARALVGRVPAPARLAIAGFAAGGMAAVDAIGRADHDVLAHRCRPRRRDVLRHGAALLRPTGRLR